MPNNGIASIFFKQLNFFIDYGLPSKNMFDKFGVGLTLIPETVYTSSLSLVNYLMTDK